MNSVAEHPLESHEFKNFLHARVSPVSPFVSISATTPRTTESETSTMAAPVFLSDVGDITMSLLELTLM